MRETPRSLLEFRIETESRLVGLDLGPGPGLGVGVGVGRGEGIQIELRPIPLANLSTNNIPNRQREP